MDIISTQINQITKILNEMKLVVKNSSQLKFDYQYSTKDTGLIPKQNLDISQNDIIFNVNENEIEVKNTENTYKPKFALRKMMTKDQKKIESMFSKPGSKHDNNFNIGTNMINMDEDIFLDAIQDSLSFDNFETKVFKIQSNHHEDSSLSQMKQKKRSSLVSLKENEDYSGGNRRKPRLSNHFIQEENVWTSRLVSKRHSINNFDDASCNKSAGTLNGTSSGKPTIMLQNDVELEIQEHQLDIPTTYNLNQPSLYQSSFGQSNFGAQSIVAGKNKVVEMVVDNQEDLIMISDSSDGLGLFTIEDLYIPEESAFTQFWNLLVTFILIFYILTFPFERFSEKWLSDLPEQVLTNIILEWFIIADILINFWTSQIDQFGKHIKSPIQISIQYLKTWFILDVFSSIPTNNMEQFELININNNNFNVYLRLLKLPRYFRVIKGFMKLLESKFSSVLDTSFFETQSKSEQRMINALKQLALLLLLSNTLGCFLISFALPCDPSLDCHNWFQQLMEMEQQMALNNKIASHHAIAMSIQERDLYNPVVEQQNYIIKYQRFDLQQDAWQFIVQTVTTVGQGDISAQSTQERLFRSLCMVIGVINFSLLSANFMEYVISDAMNIQKNNKHLEMIEKLLEKQKISGVSRRQLYLLGDSVQTESVGSEIEFIELLPTQMKVTVLNFIWNQQTTRMAIFKEETIEYFKMFMSVAHFRRCIQEECINSPGEAPMIAVMQSGQVGVKIANVNKQMQEDQLQQLGVGDEIGQNHYLEVQGMYSYVCIINSEIVEIDNRDQLDLLQNSFKGLRYAEMKITEQAIDMQMVVSLYYAMMKMGLHIDYKWYKFVIDRYNFNQSDFTVLKRLYKNFIKKKDNKVDDKVKKRQTAGGKWQSQVLDNDTFKQIKNKSISTIINNIKDQQDDLKIQMKRKQLNHLRMGSISTDKKLSQK